MSCSVKLLAVVVLAAAVSGAAVPMTAQASEPLGKGRVTVVRVKVPVGDLDLGQPAGADELLRRVELAAGRACGYAPGVSVLMVEQAREYRRCKARTIRKAVAAVDAPLVRQRYAERDPPVELAATRP